MEAGLPAAFAGCCRWNLCFWLGSGRLSMPDLRHVAACRSLPHQLTRSTREPPFSTDAGPPFQRQPAGQCLLASVCGCEQGRRAQASAAGARPPFTASAAWHRFSDRRGGITARLLELSLC